MLFDKVEDDNDYSRKNYDRFSVFLPKGTKAAVKSIAEEKQVSVNQLFANALQVAYGLDFRRS